MRKTHASSFIHIVNFIKCLFSTHLHVCPCRVETKSSRLFSKVNQRKRGNPASILRKSTSGRHRPVSYPDGPMTARYRFT